MKFIKTVIITLLVMAILFTGIFMAGRYGWKVFGFRACEEAAITSVDVSESAVTIKGFYPGSFPEGFCGCYTEELGGKLYVGFRFSAVFGIFETGDFHVAIPVEGEIDEVILKTGAGETSIWKKEVAAPDDGSSHDTAATEAPTAAEPVLTLPILDDIDENVAADGTEYSTMVTAVCGNGVEFGIKIASLPGQWFTAPAPMMKGRYTSSEFTEKDQLPWMGDSCVVECYGMGGFAAAASPIVCNLRGMTLKESIGQTKEMYRITMEKNYNFPIPNLDFDFLPVGIDIRKVLKEGVCPAIHGGMFNRVGGLIGAGMARVPMQCFEKALVAFGEKYL